MTRIHNHKYWVSRIEMYPMYYSRTKSKNIPTCMQICSAVMKLDCDKGTHYEVWKMLNRHPLIEMKSTLYLIPRPQVTTYIPNFMKMCSAVTELSSKRGSYVRLYICIQQPTWVFQLQDCQNNRSLWYMSIYNYFFFFYKYIIIYIVIKRYLIRNLPSTFRHFYYAKLF